MKKTLKIDALVLLFSLIICAQILTYIVPQGSFDRLAATPMALGIYSSVSFLPVCKRSCHKG